MVCPRGPVVASILYMVCNLATRCFELHLTLKFPDLIHADIFQKTQKGEGIKTLNCCKNKTVTVNPVCLS